MLNAGKLELMKSQYAYKEKVSEQNKYKGAWSMAEFVEAEDRGNPNLPLLIQDQDKLNLQNVITCAVPRFFAKLHREFSQAVGVQVRKVNKA